jgi:hypothetical protein
MKNHNTDADTDPGTKTVISGRTKLPLSLVVILVGFCTAQTTLTLSIKYDLKKQFWLLEDQRMWVAEIVRLNYTNVYMPDVDNVYQKVHGKDK